MLIGAFGAQWHARGAFAVLGAAAEADVALAAIYGLFVIRLRANKSSPHRDQQLAMGLTPFLQDSIRCDRLNTGHSLANGSVRAIYLSWMLVVLLAVDEVHADRALGFCGEHPKRSTRPACTSIACAGSRCWSAAVGRARPASLSSVSHRHFRAT